MRLYALLLLRLIFLFRLAFGRNERAYRGTNIYGFNKRFYRYTYTRSRRSSSSRRPRAFCRLARSIVPASRHATAAPSSRGIAAAATSEIPVVSSSRPFFPRPDPRARHGDLREFPVEVDRLRLATAR